MLFALPPPVPFLLGLLAGGLLLFAGRRLFWLFVAIAGFLAGMQLVGMFLIDQPPWLRMLVGVGCGILGAVLAVIAQRLAFVVAGFLAGGYLAWFLALTLGLSHGFGLIWLLGGAAGGLAAFLLTDPAIIVLSSLAGAALISTLLPTGPLISLAVFFLLATSGILVQSRLTGRDMEG